MALSAAACDDGLIDLACLVAHARQTQFVYAVYGIEVPFRYAMEDEMPAEQRAAEAALARATKRAWQHRVHLDGRWVRTRDWGSTLVQLVQPLGGALLIIGAPRLASIEAPGGWEEEIAGDRASEVVDYVLRNASCEVWMERIPASSDVVTAA